MNDKKNAAVRVIVMFVSIIFAVLVVGCGTSPKDAISKNDSKAITKMYKEAKDKNKIAEEIRQAFLEKAFVIIDKKDNDSRLKEERALLSTLYPMHFYDTDDATKYLLNAYNDFERASNADSRYVKACQNFYKNNGMQFTSLSGSDLKVSELSVYIASKVNRDDPKSTEYYCTGHKKVLSTFDAMQMSGYVGRIIDNPDIPDDSFECVLDFGSDKYVKSGVVDVTAIFVKSGDFTDARGFNKKLDIFRVVNPHIAQDIQNTSKDQAEYLETKKTFKDNAKSGNKFSYRPKKTEKKQDEAKTEPEERSVQAKQTQADGISSDQAIGCIMDYSAALRNKRFKEAYSKYSSDWQSQSPYNAWRHGYDNTISQTMEVTGVRNENTDCVTVTFRLKAEDRGNSGQIIRQTFKGTWDVIREDGKLVLDNPDVKVAD